MPGISNFVYWECKYFKFLCVIVTWMFELWTMDSHQTFSDHLTEKTRQDLPYIVNGELNKCVIGKQMSDTPSSQAWVLQVI